MNRFSKIKLFFYSLKAMPSWITHSIEKYNSKKQRAYHCKLIDIEKNETNQFEASIKIEGIQGVHSSLPVTYLLQDLIKNESMLSELSQADVKMLTFYAFYEKFVLKNKTEARYKIDSQEFLSNRTIFIIYDHLLHGYLRKSSIELFDDNAALIQFELNDIKNIIATATQEETFLNLENLQSDSQYT